MLVLNVLFFALSAFAQTKSVAVCYAPDTAQAIIIFTASDRPPILESEFSISDTTKVRFASGNLMYQPYTRTWKLAPRQYDIVGGVQSLADVPTSGNRHGTIWETIDGVRTRCTNDGNHNKNYKGWIDLFPWGSSGWYGSEPEIGEVAYDASEPDRKNNNPKKKITGAPYEVNNGNANWKLNNSNTQGFNGDWVNADWGIFNNVMLGGNEDSVFRTPTLGEAKYLLADRPNAHSLRARARIRIPGVGAAPDTLINGIILLPDDWDPAILPNKDFLSDADGCVYYSDNEYTAEEFDRILEPLGAIFLPAAGGMSGNNSIKANRSGYYWGATPDNTSTKSYDMQFGGYDASGAIHSDRTERKYCRAVRLVVEIKETTPSGGGGE